MKQIPAIVLTIFIFILSTRSIYAANAFTDTTASSGITSNGSLRGINWLDLNEDGYPDIYLSYLSKANFVFLNDGDNTFTNASSQDQYNEVVDVSASHWQPTWFDIDNDKDMDLFLPIFSPSGTGARLYINNGAGNGFTQDSSDVYNLKQASGFMSGGLPIDVDNDGDEDLFVLRTTSSSVLMLNNGQNTSFTDATTEYGLTGINSSNSVTSGDIDNDGDFDLYFTSQSGAAKFYINNGHGLGFTDATIDYGLSASSVQTASMVDVNKDGLLDVYLGRSSGSENILYINNGPGQAFTNATETYGIKKNNSSATFNTSWIDIDNDGDLDVLVHRASGGTSMTHLLYINNGSNTAFTESIADYNLDDSRTLHLNNTWADIDLDGDLDLLIGRESSSGNFLYINPGQGNNYLTFIVNNNDGLYQYNARVEVDLDGNNDFSTSGNYVMQYQTTPARGGLGQYLVGISPSDVHFGLGSDASCKYDVRIFLHGTDPDSTPDYSFENVCPNQTITTGRANVSSTNQPSASTTATVTGTTTSTLTYSTITGLEAQAGGTGGTWTTCTATDGSFDSTSEQFSCDLPLASLSADGTSNVYYRASTSVGSTFTSLDYISSTSSLSRDTAQPSSSSTKVTVTDPDTGKTYDKYFTLTSISDLTSVSNTQFPTFCFTKAYDTTGGSGISKYTLIVDGRDYLGDVQYNQPSVNGSDIRQDSDNVVIKETDEYILKYINYNKIPEKQEICAWGKADKKKLHTGFHIWSVRVTDNVGNSVETGSSRFLVGTYVGSFNGSTGGTSGWGENIYQVNNWFPLTVLQMGNIKDIQDLTSLQNNIFSYDDPYIVSTANPTFYGIANVGTTVNFILEKESVDAFSGDKRYDAVLKKEVKTNESSRFGINLSESDFTPDSENLYIGHFQAYDTSGNIALIKNVPIKFTIKNPSM